MRAASSHSEWLWVSEIRFVIFFFFLMVRSVTWDFRLVSNLGGSRLQICGFGIGILNRFGFGIGVD
jgi:hypothetical protein